MRLFGGQRDTNPFYPPTGAEFGKLRKAVERGAESLAADQATQIVQLYDALIRRLDDQLVELSVRTTPALNSLPDNSPQSRQKPRI